MQDTPNILNATLPLKQDAESQAKLKEFAAEFATKWQPQVWDVLLASQMVHYARFTVIDNKYLQILTEYDTDFITYSKFFAKYLGDFFRTVFGLVDGGPASAAAPDLVTIFEFIKSKDLSNVGGRAFAAYGPRTVKEVQQKFGISVKDVQAKLGVELTPVPRGGHVAAPGSSAQESAMTTPLVSIDPENVQGIVAHPYTHPVCRHLLFTFGSAAERGLPPCSSTGDVGRRLDDGRARAGAERGPVLLRPESYRGRRRCGPGAIPDNVPGRSESGAAARQPRRRLVERGGRGRTALPGQPARSRCAGRDELTGACSPPRRTAAPNTASSAPTARPLTVNSCNRPAAFTSATSMVSVAQRSPGKTRPRIPTSISAISCSATQPTPSTRGRATWDTRTESRGGGMACDGSYAAFRVMYQDVAGFNGFLADNARRLAGPLRLNEAEAEEWLAAKMLGRWRDGRPLVLAPTRDAPPVRPEDDFRYAGDPDGRRCPFSAHIRIVNPRPARRSGARAGAALLRRGMPYGKELEGTADDGVDRGLIGLFLCSSLGDQFEKLMDWINRNDFSGVFTDLRAQDPLLGNRDLPLASTDFLIPTSGGLLTATGLKTFVRTRGTAYFLFPGIQALRQLSAAP